MVKKFQVNLTFSDKMFYSFIVLGIISIFGIGVYAYGTTTPSVMGHSAGELEESDPTVPANVKDGVSCAEVSGCVQNAITDVGTLECNIINQNQHGISGFQFCANRGYDTCVLGISSGGSAEECTSNLYSWNVICCRIN